MKPFILAAALAFLLQDAASQVIPVVVHIISRNPDSISDQDIRLAIDDLNDAFAHTGIYQGIGAGYQTGISFCLAKTDPKGGITNGITRTRHELSDFDKDVEDKKLKSLISWDTRKYCNIWIVEGLKNEMDPLYSCGLWERSSEPGYGTFLPKGEFHDGIVITRFGGVLAHNMGHYLGLAHIFSFRDCSNNNCAVDGDGVCDTPPASRGAVDCTPGPNTCNTDTLSGFSSDVPDLPGNFMNTTLCNYSFTKGQADKMKFNLTSQRASLLQGNRCSPPCPEQLKASFRRDNWFPAIGDTIRFQASDVQGQNIEWLIDNIVVGGNATRLVKVFNAVGSYDVTLKVFNSDPSCFASYSDKVIVTCGVMARFFPDKRNIASKDPLKLDTIAFKNRSIGGTSFKWLLSHVDSTVESVISTDFDLNHIFQDTGRYWIRLAALNGSCSDTTDAFRIRVIDPTPDATSHMSVDCYQDTLLLVRLRVCNGGYALIPKGLPISFYDGDPTLPGTRKVDTTYLLPDSVKGICCSNEFTLLLRTGGRRLDSLYMVANDSGTIVPIRLPATSLPEMDYANNRVGVTGIKFRTSASPSSVLASAFDNLSFQAVSTPVSTATRYVWSRSGPLSCTECPSPSFLIGIYPDTLRLRAISRYGCTDSTMVPIRVRPVHDYRIRIDASDCYRDDSIVVDFTLCDTFFLGKVPKGLSVSFFDSDPSFPGSQRLGNSFLTSDSSNARCMSYRHVIRAVRPGRMIFAAVNDVSAGPGLLSPDTLLQETDFRNNFDSSIYQQESMTIVPIDTLVERKRLVPVVITSRVYDPSSIRWEPRFGQLLSCQSGCSATQVVATRADTLRVQMSTRYGCTLRAQSVIRITPPDFTVDIIGTNCYTNTTTLVRFRICVGNGYDTLPKGLPISMYSSYPRQTMSGMPFATYILPSPRARACDTFSMVVPTPKSLSIYAAVNQRNSARYPDTVFVETDINNNIDTATIIPFTARIVPRDTFVIRMSGFRLSADVRGGTASTFLWQPGMYLGCTICPDAIGSIPFTNRFTLQTRNEYSCTYIDTVLVSTYSEGLLHVPNAFTPNGDRRNDILYIIGNKDVLQVEEFSIYDRYGQRVFHVENVPANDPRFGWDGTRKGMPVAAGSFVYAARVRLVDARIVPVKGVVTVIR